MPERSEITDTMAGLALFADLNRAQLEGVAHVFEEQWFEEGERILRQGLGGSALYVILDGEATVTINGVPTAGLGRGDFFGEISVLLNDPPSADVVAVRPVHCAVLSGPDVEGFLMTYPRVMFRMLQAQARRLRQASRWRS
ncbi:MAG: Crp/Fnr family transcriptional regulator [bacterium]